MIGTTGWDLAPLRESADRRRNVFVAPELRDRRRADDALRRRGLAAHGARPRSSSCTTTASSTRPSGTAARTARADGRRRADPLGAPAGARRPPGGHPRRRRPDADDPPRLDRPHVVHARRAARGPPRGATRPSRRSSGSSTCCDPAGADADARGDRRVQARTWRWAYARHHRRRGTCPVATSACAALAEYIAGGRRCACSTRTGRSSASPRARGRRAHALYVDPAAQGAGVGGRLLAEAQERLRAAGQRGRRCRSSRPTATAAPSTSAAAGAGRRAAWRADALAAPGRRYRARRLSVLVAVTDHAAERFRQRVGGPRAIRRAPRDRARVARAWEAGRVEDEPPPGATARPSTCATSSTARSSSSAAMTAPPRAGRHHAVGGGGRRRAAARGAKWTDALRRRSG